MHGNMTDDRPVQVTHSFSRFYYGQFSNEKRAASTLLDRREGWFAVAHGAAPASHWPVSLLVTGRWRRRWKALGGGEVKSESRGRGVQRGGTAGIIVVFPWFRAKADGFWRFSRSPPCAAGQAFLESHG